MYQDVKSTLQAREAYLKQVITAKQKDLSNAPENILRCRQQGNHYYYYLKGTEHDAKEQYLPVKEKDAAIAVAQSDYDRRVLKLAQKELEQIKRLLLLYENGAADDVYEKMCAARQFLITPLELPDRMYAEEWRSVEYNKKGFMEGDPEYYTELGERVRSKSELIIANTLARFQIPYRYECPLMLKSVTIHPDFMVLNVHLRKVFLWEHFGMMDDPGYFEKAWRRIEMYERNGILAGEKLIITCETAKSPINTRQLENTIRQRFL